MAAIRRPGVTPTQATPQPDSDLHRGGSLLRLWRVLGNQRETTRLSGTPKLLLRMNQVRLALDPVQLLKQVLGTSVALGLASVARRVGGSALRLGQWSWCRLAGQ